MLKKLIQWSLDNRALVLILTLILVGVGIYALWHTPVDAIPDLSDVQVIVKTTFPGQAPRVVEDQVTYPITTAMLSVPGATVVRGFSFFGDSYVYVLFQDGTDPYWARSRVLEYLNQVKNQLPPNVQPQLGPDATGVGWVYQYALVDKTGKHNLADLTSLQNWLLKFELQSVPGVAEVATVGGHVKQYQIMIHPNRLRAYHLTLSQVKQAIQQANQEAGGSVVELAEAEYMVRSRGYISNLAHLRDVVVGMKDNHVPILLKDIATIQLGPQMRRGIAELNGQGEVVGGTIVMRQGANALKTIQNVKAKLKTLQASLPKGVQIVEVYNRATLIQRAIHTLNRKIIEELLLVILVCGLFLFHFRSSLIIVISLPIGVLIAFIIMYFQGINANIMSLGGIAIAIGAMVDAAIVMIENCHKKIEHQTDESIDRWQIVSEAAQEVGPALFFSLLIVTLSFLPVFSLQGQEGKLFAPLAFTKTYAMAGAAFLSLTLVPVLMGYFIRGKIIPEYKNPLNKLLILIYRPAVEFILRYPKTIICAAIILLIVGFWPISHLGSEFMPDLNEGDLMYMPTTLPGISIGKAQQLLQQTDKLIKAVPEVKSVFGKIGRAQTATDPAPLTMIETIIQFKPKSEWRKGMTLTKLKEILDKRVKLPGVTNAWVMPIKTRIDMLATGIKTPIGIKISGPKLSKIQTISQNIEQLLKTLPDTASAYAERAASGRYIDINIKRQQAARYGLTIAEIQSVIQTAIGGMNLTQTVEGLERYPINLRYPQTFRDSVFALKQLPIITKSGTHITLEDVATIQITQGPAVVKSENARPTSWVLVDLKHSDVGSYIQQAKILLKKELVLPAGYSLSWSGQYEYMQRAKARLTWVVPLTLVIIILLLYLNFRRWQEVLIILGTLPMALIGGIWLLYLLNYHLSVAVGVGFIALAGVAVEIGVVMLVYLNQAWEKKCQSLSNQNQVPTNQDLKQAIMEGSLLRIRPIMMTVSTVIIGLLPIMFSSETGAEVMRRIAAPMVGGMVSAIILGLLLIPTIYWLWKKK